MKAHKRTRLHVRIEEFRVWWLGLDEARRAQQADRLKRMGDLAQELLDATEGAFGPRFWDVVVEVAKGFFLFGKTPAEQLVALKEGMPEVWPVVLPILPKEIVAELREIEETKP